MLHNFLTLPWFVLLIYVVTRKEMITSGVLNLVDDWKFSGVVLSKHPRSAETFSHRWELQLLQQIHGSVVMDFRLYSPSLNWLVKYALAIKRQDKGTCLIKVLIQNNDKNKTTHKWKKTTFNWEKNHQLNNIDFSEKIHVPYVKIYSENNLSA